MAMTHLNRALCKVILCSSKSSPRFCCSYFRSKARLLAARSEHNIVTSLHDPAVKIRLPNAAVYLGADRWILYDIADGELHAFVESDSSNWVQFEQYEPTRPDLHHTYDSPRHTTLGGMDFYVDTWVRAKTEPSQPGREHIVGSFSPRVFRCLKE
jgi:hypothetical protein